MNQADNDKTGFCCISWVSKRWCAGKMEVTGNWCAPARCGRKACMSLKPVGDGQILGWLSCCFPGLYSDPKSHAEAPPFSLV